MLQIFKKFFSLKIFSKKIFLACLVPKQRLWFGVFLLFLFLALFFPVSSAQAQAWYVKALLFLPSALASFLLEILLLAGQGILWLGNYILNWAIKGPFDIDKLSFTDPTRNSIIKVGWTLLRDITNMFFILGLAYIGLATSLNLAGFETKKIFANLLLIALLINFTPVICGVIVDVSNILANFFLKGVNFDPVLENYSIQRGIIKSHWANLLTEMGVLLSAICLVVYAFLGTFVFLLFALLFLVRYLAIWILVILSPLAFFTWIFPETKGKVWDMWWNQFLQWSFVIVPASFFLYLSQHILANIEEFTTSYPGDPTGGAFAQIAPYFVALLFLIFGFVITLKINAMGAGATIGVGKKIGGAAGVAGKWVGKKAGKIGTGLAVGAATGAVAGAAEGAKEEKGIGRITGAAKGAFKGAFTRAGREKGIEAGERILEKAHVVRPGFYEEKRRERWKIDEEAKRLETLPSERLHGITERKAITSRDVAGKMAAFETLAKRGKLRDEEKKLIPQAEAFGVNLDEVEKARPDWVPITQSRTVEKLIKEQGLSEDEAKKEVTKKTIEKMTPRKFRDRVQTEALQNTDVFAALDAQKIKDLGFRGEMEKKKQLVETVYSKELQEYVFNLMKAGKVKEADKAIENMANILNDANFQGLS